MARETGDLGVDNDAYLVAPWPTLYVMGAACTVLFTLVVVQAVVLSPIAAVNRPINTRFIFTIALTLFYFPTSRRVTVESCVGHTSPLLFYIR